MTWKPDICVYHGGCDDGYGAAFIIGKYGSYIEEKDFIPAGYGTPLEKLFEGRSVEDKNILIVDFSFKRDVMIDLARGISLKVAPASIVVLDHHKTAQAELAEWNVGPVLADSYRQIEGHLADRKKEGQCPIVAHFDMEHSGAMMAWDFLKLRPAPEMIQLIEDRDLFTFRHGDRTRQFSAALRTYPHDFMVWEDILKNTERVLGEGAVVLRGHMKNIQQILANKYTAHIGGFDVPVVNATYHYASDAAHQMLVDDPHAPFAASWFKRADGKIQLSLRSENARVDVSEIAKMFGGGGHRNAAGFELPDVSLLTSSVHAHKIRL